MCVSFFSGFPSIYDKIEKGFPSIRRLSKERKTHLIKYTRVLTNGKVILYALTNGLFIYLFLLKRDNLWDKQ